jgi:hypothetical protein
MNKLYHRNELTKTIADLYNLGDLEPQLHQVILSDNSTIKVPVFDDKAVILSILHDPPHMQQHNCVPGYDIFSGKPTELANLYVNEIHMGSLWKTARDFHCGTNTDNFPLALLCFYDKTSTDLYGSLSYAPYMITFLFFSMNLHG